MKPYLLFGTGVDRAEAMPDDLRGRQMITFEAVEGYGIDYAHYLLETGDDRLLEAVGHINLGRGRHAFFGFF